MTLTTTGKIIVWCVFNADGYECSDLVGVFEDEEAAVQVADKLRTLAKSYYDGGSWSGSIDVKPQVLGEYEFPPDAREVLKSKVNQ